MKFFFYTRYIKFDSIHDGLSRYKHELALALYDLDPKITFIISDERQLNLLPKGVNHVKIHPVTSWKEPFTALILNKFHPNVVATPLQSMGSFGRRFKLILNQQDMTYYKHSKPPANFPWYVRLTWRLYHLTYWPGRLTLNAADVVATVSETSKREIEAARLTKRPLVVVSNAARDLSPYLRKSVVQKSTSPKNLVFMGSLLPHKNALTLVRMMEFLPGRTLHLLSKGSPDYTDLLKKNLPDGAKVKFYGGVSDEQYAQVLADDAIMVSASKSEGFGLPLAEALKLGVPAVVSDIAPFHEVAADGALYADPNDPVEFAKKIASLDGVKARQQLVKKGRTHIDTFNWHTSAAMLLRAVQALYEPNGQ
jgi:glycosyltransferase involved in cell wall biosynthesis